MKSFLLLFLLYISYSSFAQELPIFKEKLTKGVYQTFEEFKFNKPSITDSLHFDFIARKTENWDDTFEVIPRYANKNKKVKKAWGFCDGEKAYLFHQLEFFEIDLSKNKFTFFGYGQLKKNSGTTGAIIGGAIGYSIEQAAATAKIKKQKIQYHINQSNGKLSKLNDVAYGDMAEQPDVYIVFYRYGKKEIPGKVSIMVNDSIEIALEPYSYDQIKFKVSGDPVKIDYGDGVTFIDVDIKSEENKYVEVSHSTKKNKEKLVEWEDVTGEFYSKKAKSRQLEREGQK